jgi:hypothetical protein
MVLQLYALFAAFLCLNWTLFISAFCSMFGGKHMFAIHFLFPFDLKTTIISPMYPSCTA